MSQQRGTDTSVSAVGKGLRPSSLGLVSSIVLGISATAPAYSVAASVGFIVLAVGTSAPAMLLVAFVPMMCVAVAFAQLNRIDPDCGTAFTWAARAFGPRTGWIGGWVMTLASVIAMAYLAGMAASYVFLLVGADSLATSTSATTAAGLVLIAVMTLVCWRGIELSIWVQRVLLCVELLMLVVFAATALIEIGTGHAPAGHLTPSWTWLNPFQAGSLSTITDGVLVAVFLYWGWDSAISVNEETEQPRRNPGRAAVISMALLIGIFLLTTVAAQAYAGTGDSGIGLRNPNTAADLLAVVGEAVLGTAWGKLLILAVLSSAIAALQTGILPTARTVLAMAAHKALPDRLGAMNSRYQTPSVATFTIGGASAVLFVAFRYLDGGKLAADAIASIGLLIALYYALVGYTCAWTLRRELTRGTKDLVLKAVLPLLGALTLTAVLVESVWQMRSPDYGATSVGGVGGVLLIGGGTVLLGVLLMLAYSVRRPEFFRTKLPPAAPEAEPGSGAVSVPVLAPAPTGRG
jgi:amino acid transporter